MRSWLPLIVLTTRSLCACSDDSADQGSVPADGSATTGTTPNATVPTGTTGGTGSDTPTMTTPTPTGSMPSGSGTSTATAMPSTSGTNIGATGAGGSNDTGSAGAEGAEAAGSDGSAGSDNGSGATGSTDVGAAGADGSGGGPPATGSGGAAGTPNAGGAAGAGGGASEPEPCVVDHGDEIPSLHEYYADHFAIGAAIDTQYNNYAGLLTKHFNSVTAEDQMKFDALQPSEGNFTYGTADQMVNFATSNGMQVRGHALVWHRQTPSWVFSGSSQQVLERMKTHINNVMQHFQGKVQVWDVVNEAIMDDGTYRTGSEEGDDQSSGWYGALGESYIAEAFIAARAADPAAKLFYNDYYNYHPVRRQAIYEMLAGLLEDEVPIDGVGLQCHINLAPGTDPNEQSYHQTVENMEEAIEMYSSLGLDVQITEMDLSVYLRGIQYTPDTFYTPETFTPEVQEQQAERYREFFDMFRKHSDKISSVSLWGIADDNTWLSEFSSGRQDFPLLFDAQQQPKPAFWAVVDFCQ